MIHWCYVLLELIAAFAWLKSICMSKQAYYSVSLSVYLFSQVKNINSVTIEMYISDGMGSSLCTLDSVIIAVQVNQISCPSPRCVVTDKVIHIWSFHKRKECKCLSGVAGRILYLGFCIFFLKFALVLRS